MNFVTIGRGVVHLNKMKAIKTKNKKKSRIPFRLNMLFFIVFLLFSTLVLRLGVVQIVYGEDYKKQIERTEDITVNNPVPRGKILDRNYKIVVDNIPEDAITYTAYQDTDAKEKLKVAKRLSKMIDVKTDKITERDKQDYWILTHPKEAEKKITQKDRNAIINKHLTSDEESKQLYQMQLDRITKEELNSLTEEDLKILAIFREFNSGYALTAQMVKNEGVTKEEFAKVSENLQSLPGVDTTKDWKRSYAFGDTLTSVLGNVSTSNEGIPKEQLDYYLARGYNRNDRVGKSYIEMQYEDVLHGQKAKVKNVTQKGKLIESDVISEGQRGKDLVLTIDMDLQKAVEAIIEKQLWRAKSMANTYLLDRALVVLMDPHTGEVLTMAGKQIVRDEKTGQQKMTDLALGNIISSYNVGSAVKGATILTGYKTGVISPGHPEFDTPVLIQGSEPKKSWRNLGYVTDITALKYSSNVYMFMTAIKIGKGHYVPNGPIDLDPKAYDTIRQSFAQFGLGVRTGIDLPNEQVGFKGTRTDEPGKLLDLAIGQYDTYTNMQLAQYVSTIANGGYRIKPHLVKELREPVMDDKQLGPVFQEIKPTVLNHIDAKEEWINQVKIGFREVMTTDGTGAGAFSGKPYTPAGKTGTAEAFYDGPLRSQYGKEPPSVMNLSLVAFAPYENPEVAMAVIVPWAYQAENGHHANLDIGSEVLDTYFALKKQRMEQSLKNPNPVQKITTADQVKSENAKQADENVSGQ